MITTPTNSIFSHGQAQANQMYNNYTTFGGNAQSNMMSVPAINYIPNNSTMRTNVIQVPGPETAKSYPVAIGQMLIMFDSERPIFYQKMKDANGFETFEIFDYTQRGVKEETPPVQNTDVFVTKDYLDETLKKFKDDIEKLVVDNA